MHHRSRRLRAPFVLPEPTSVSRILFVLTAALHITVPMGAAGQATPPSAVPAAESGDSIPVTPWDPFRADTVLAVPGIPRVILLNSVDGGLATLRLSVALEEGPAEAGAGQILRDLALARMDGLAGPVSARVDARRTPWGLVYSVVGAAADLEYLAYLLREAVSEPSVRGGGVEAARVRLAEAVARDSETPAGRLVGTLRQAIAPHLTPLLGTESTVASLDAARILSVWRRSHRPEAMELVIAAPVVPEVVLAVVRGMGVTQGEAAPALDAPAPPEGRRPPAETLRHWYGVAWSAGPTSDPRATVLAPLLSEYLAGSQGDFETGVQLRALSDRWLLVVGGAAYPQDARRMRDVVSGALAAARASLTEEWVDQTVSRVRRELLFSARTPSGLVERVGHGVESAGHPSAASEYHRTLAATDLAAMVAYVDELLAAEPATAEVRP